MRLFAEVNRKPHRSNGTNGSNASNVSHGSTRSMEQGRQGVGVRRRWKAPGRGGVFGLLLCGCLVVAAAAQDPNPSPLEHQAQPPTEGSQGPAQGGSSTAGAHAAILDAQHRPITAGGFVTSGPVIFKDIAEKAGLGAWTHHMGERSPRATSWRRWARVWR